MPLNSKSLLPYLLVIPLIGLFWYLGTTYRVPQPSGEITTPPSGTMNAPQSENGGETKPPPPVVAGASVSAAAVKTCLSKAGTSGECLDKLFREYLKSNTTQAALLLVQNFQMTDQTIRLSCHPVVHAIGRETFLLKKTIHESFAACDQTCHSGCYHGAMERFLRGDIASDDEAGHISKQELAAKAASACDASLATRFRFQCLHGLGHALVFFSDYDLRGSLETCDATGDAWSQSSCYGGVFMENVHSATPAKRDLSATDFQYPCNSLAEKYRPDCYMMQTTRMVEMGLKTPDLFAECRKVSGSAKFTRMQSIGRDLSNDARIGKAKSVAEKCELGADEERRACTRGVAYALVDNTWNGQYAFPFCALFNDTNDAAYCFGISAGYLRGTFEKNPADLNADCKRYAPNTPACAAAADGA